MQYHSDIITSDCFDLGNSVTREHHVTHNKLAYVAYYTCICNVWTVN